jgi:hypothetical protein
MQLSRDGNWGDVNWVRRTLEDTNQLDSVHIEVLSYLDHIQSAEDFTSRYGTMVQWVMEAQWSEEVRAAHPFDEVQQLLCDHLEKKYGGRPWDLTWTAIVALGAKKMG